MATKEPDVVCDHQLEPDRPKGDGARIIVPPEMMDVVIQIPPGHIECSRSFFISDPYHQIRIEVRS